MIRINPDARGSLQGSRASVQFRFYPHLARIFSAGPPQSRREEREVVNVNGKRATEGVGELGRSWQEIIVVFLRRSPIPDESEVMLRVLRGHQVDVPESSTNEEVQERAIDTAQGDVEVNTIFCSQRQVPRFLYDLAYEFNRQPWPLGLLRPIGVRFSV